ncbi:MAG: PadR family transcriptional regulator [Candidatus Hodarchaeota archaeon]
MLLEERLKGEITSNLLAYLILVCINKHQGVSYGYQMKLFIEDLLQKSVLEGTLYSLLSKLADKKKYGYLESFQEETERKRIRRFYRLTEKGRQQLEKWPKKWNELKVFVDNTLLEVGMVQEISVKN